MKGSKRLTVLLCAVLCIVLLFACGQQGEDPVPTMPTTVSTEPRPIPGDAQGTEPTDLPQAPQETQSTQSTHAAETVPAEPTQSPDLDENELPPVPLW